MPFFALLLIFLTGLIGTFSDEAVAEQKSQYNRAPHNKTPLGLPELPAAKNDTPEQILLGQKLFFEKQLSRDGSLSCATCHKPAEAFTEYGMKTSPGFKEQKNRRNTPTLLNAAYYHRLHLDGRETSFETQFILPLTAHDEMASRSVGYVLTKLGWLPGYKELFQKAFGTEPTVGGMGKALAAYQRTLLSANSRFDRWHFGNEKQLLNKKEQAGFQIFTGKGDCASCHQIGEKNALFTDQAFHDIGHVWEQNQNKKKKQDLGRYEVTLDERDRWRIRTPSLRNVAKTAPYMHDGAFSSLKQVIEFYNKGGAPHKGQDVRIKKLNLSEDEIESLVAFLETLTGDNLDQLSKTRN